MEKKSLQKIKTKINAKYSICKNYYNSLFYKIFSHQSKKEENKRDITKILNNISDYLILFSFLSNFSFILHHIF